MRKSSVIACAIALLAIAALVAVGILFRGTGYQDPLLGTLTTAYVITYLRWAYRRGSF